MENIRERRENYEVNNLSFYATLSKNSRGREREEVQCDIRTCFQRDRDRIIHCKSFRRLKHKTQVFLAPTGDHYRTRLTHTLEVSQIARTIANALWLNEDLTEAIALGHDLGHTPFGHAGERALNEKCLFKHSIQSVRIIDFLEDNKGLNLTYEVRDGILNHGLSSKPETMEGNIVRFADKLAYINHDMDDAMRAGILHEEDVPFEIKNVLGNNRKERLDLLIKDIIYNSYDQNTILMSDKVFSALLQLRSFMFEKVYHNPKCKQEEKKAMDILKMLFDYYVNHVEELPEEIMFLITDRGEKIERAVCDYISGMTDVYAVALYKELFVPKSWHK